MTKERPDYYVEMSLCISGKCDRGCSHCFMNGNMEGALFSPKKALLLSREIRRITKKVSREKRHILFNIHLTGEGEALLNPEMIDVLDMIMGINENVRCSLITSGVNHKSSQEIELMKKLLSRSYIGRINFCLSFNEFEKRFPKRLIYNLNLLFSKSIQEVTVKVCVPLHYRKVLSLLATLIFGHFSKWPKKEHPLLSNREIFISTIKEIELLDPVPSDCRLDMNSNPVSVIESAKKRFANILPPSRKELFCLEEWLSMNFRETIKFETENGPRRIIFSPHFLTKLGRAEKLGPKFTISEKDKLCGYLKDECSLHLGADGYYYPSGLCRKFKLGHIEDNLEVILWRHRYFRKIFLEAILADANLSRNLCSICLETVEQYRKP